MKKTKQDIEDSIKSLQRDIESFKEDINYLQDRITQNEAGIANLKKELTFLLEK